jgi:flagellar protein FliJ
MTFSYSLQSVLKVKEHEKGEAQQRYSSATEAFEEAATGLYERLKQKEELEQTYSRSLETGTTVSELNHLQNRIRFLETQIRASRETTDLARARMRTSEARLGKKSADVLKYDKIRERKLADYNQERKLQEMKNLDELAVQQFLRK